MKLHENIQPRMNLVGRYGPDGITVNGQNLTRPVIIAPGFLHAQWIEDAAGLTADSLAPVWPLEPRILLLGGTGFATAQLQALRKLLVAREIALEAMDLGAACRTYNVLAQEDRAVAALLFPA
ncbi:MAG TPA: Mth938-like domain-containing protein [Steroidobacteraceae bacterium]|nr:Mth938-like domain-containing protein [Steroidobacteraceae bacterium]